MFMYLTNTNKTETTKADTYILVLWQKTTIIQTKFSENDIIKMLEFASNTFVTFRERVFQQTNGIPIGTNCAPLHVDLFSFVQGRFNTGAFTEEWKKLSLSFPYQ